MYYYQKTQIKINKSIVMNLSSNFKEKCSVLKLCYIARIQFKIFENISRIKTKSCHLCKRSYTNLISNDHIKDLRKPPWRVLFFGSDDFSLPCLKMLFQELLEGQLVKKLSIVTSLKGRKNLVREFAISNELSTIAWPLNTCSGDYDIGLVVSFGHLIPERVIEAFPLGMLNVHASLLPRWRGAAPIIYTILNGDTETGVTIMEVKPHKFDIGNIVQQRKCAILPTDTNAILRARLATLGAALLQDVLKNLPHCLYKSLPQPESGITYAPRITPSIAAVRWHDMDSFSVYNLHRALIGIYPLTTTWHGMPIKLFEPTLKEGTDMDEMTSNSWLLTSPGCVEVDRSGNILRVMCADKRWIGFKAIGVPGKKQMSAQDFYNGYISKKSVTEWLFI